MDASKNYEKHRHTYAPRLAALIAQRRDEAGMTRKEVATRLSVSLTSVTIWEEDFSRIQVWQFFALADLLEFDAQAELSKIFSSDGALLTRTRPSNKRTGLLKLVAKLTEKQCSAMR